MKRVIKEDRDRPVSDSERGFQLGDGQRTDTSADIVQKNFDHSSIARDIAKNYDRGRTEIHFHARGTFGLDAPVAGEFCLLFTKAVKIAPIEEIEIRSERLMNACTDRGHHRYEQSAVLVDIIQRFQEPKKMMRRLVSMVRLQSLDDCLRSHAKMFDAALPARIEPCFRTKNGEGRIRRFRIRQRPLVGKRQGICQMIKTRPEILETISDKMNNERWSKSEQLTVDNIIAVVRIEFIGKSIRATFNPAINFRPKFFQVLACPI